MDYVKKSLKKMCKEVVVLHVVDIAIAEAYEESLHGLVKNIEKEIKKLIKNAKEKEALSTIKFKPFFIRYMTFWVLAFSYTFLHIIRIRARILSEKEV